MTSLLRLPVALLFVAGTIQTAKAQIAPTPGTAPDIAPGTSQTQAPQSPTQPSTTQPSVPAATPAPEGSTSAVPVVVQQMPDPRPAVTAATPVDRSTYPAVPGYAPQAEAIHHDNLGSAYIPVDSPVYQMSLRLYSLGYLDTAFINMRPWTRRSLLHMIQLSTPAIMGSGNDQAIGILAKLNEYLEAEDPTAPMEGMRFRPRGMVYGVQSVYTRMMGISGLPLRDSYHLGETINNDYGRPYQSGFNNITGFSTLNEYGRFSLTVRGEYQHAPSSPAGYSQTLSSTLSNIDQIPFTGFQLHQDTIPTGPIGSQNPFRIQEASIGYHLLGHEISFGKSDAWLGPNMGGAMAWSNNAENPYAFRINRIEPMYIPYLDKVLGPLRYDFFVGSLQGHSYPNHPWVHSSMFSFAPTSDFQFAFQRTVIWGGTGFEPITIHTFLKSFFSFTDTESDPFSKGSRNDPGARFSDFSFSYRLPFISHRLTLTLDSICHDDVTPISAPRRAAYRPGLYLSQVPFIPKLDFRVEAASTDTSTLRSLGGQFNYYETIQRQGYTNKGVLMGDWIGREAKGGQAWLTYHLSGNEWVQLEYLDKKTPKDFIPGGTTQGQFKAEVVKRFHKDIELDAWLQVERWKAPIYLNKPDASFDTTAVVQLTWFPKLRTESPNSH